MTVKLWDIEAGMNINTLSAHDMLIQDIVWDYYGNNYATSCKDKSLRIIDARSPQVAQASAVVLFFFVCCGTSILESRYLCLFVCARFLYSKKKKKCSFFLSRRGIGWLVCRPMKNCPPFVCEYKQE